MQIQSSKGDIVIIKIDGKVMEKQFSHYEKKNGNGGYFYTTDGIKHHIKQIA
jgi:hypothetical protein